MSVVSVRAALQTKLNSMVSPISYAWENIPFTPVPGTPYAQAFLLSATPDNSTLGDGFYRAQGIFLVSIFYPLQAGTATAEAKAEAIRTEFKRGTTMTSGAVSVLVDTTPEIGQGRVDGDRWHIPIKIRWSAGIMA